MEMPARQCRPWEVAPGRALALVWVVLLLAWTPCCGRRKSHGLDSGLERKPHARSAVTGLYFLRVPKSTLALRAELKPDGTLVVEEVWLIGLCPDPVCFNGTWAREGEREVRLNLNRREQWRSERGVSKEAIQSQVVGTLLFDDRGRVSGMTLPDPAPLSREFSLRLLRVGGD
jgi:hypothetical protein